MPILPHLPKTFPPKKRHIAAFSPLLKRAHLLLDKYNTLHATLPSLFSSLSFIEARFSLESQTPSPPLDQILLSAQLHPPIKQGELPQILNYHKALTHCLRLKPKTHLSKRLTCALHNQIKQGTASEELLGCYRTQQNWIGAGGCTIDEAYFYPPQFKKVPGLMRELILYSKTTSEDPLVQTALVFAQLLIIHPFMDGNGRVARILTPFLFFQKGLPPLFLSRYFRIHRLRYFQTLFEITETNKWEKWIRFFLKAVIATTTQNLKTGAALLSLYEKLPEMPPSLLSHLFENPFFTKSSFQKAGGSLSLLKELTDSRLCRKEKTHYVFGELLKILKEASRNRS